jgi:hypothetical protein
MGNARCSRFPLAHRRVMVLEDDFLIKNNLERLLEAAGAMISSVYHPRLEAAILDIGMERGPSSTQVARELSRRGVPFFFYSGQSDNVVAPLRAEWPDAVLMRKPAPAESILQTLVDLLAANRGRLVRPGNVSSSAR